MSIEEIQERLEQPGVTLEEALLLLRMRQLHADIAQAEFEYANYMVEQSAG